MRAANTPTKADLPETARVFAEVIGFESTLRLAEVAQYNAVSVPRTIGEKHWIAKAIGYARAQALAKAFPGALMPLASCKQVAIVLRQNRFAEAYALGTSPAIIASLAGVGLTTVLNDLDATGARPYGTKATPNMARDSHRSNTRVSRDSNSAPTPGLGTPPVGVMRVVREAPASA